MSLPISFRGSNYCQKYVPVHDNIILKKSIVQVLVMSVAYQSKISSRIHLFTKMSNYFIIHLYQLTRVNSSFLSLDGAERGKKISKSLRISLLVPNMFARESLWVSLNNSFSAICTMTSFCGLSEHPEPSSRLYCKFSFLYIL